MRKLVRAIALSVVLCGCASPLAWTPPTQTSTRMPSAALGTGKAGTRIGGIGGGPNVGTPSHMLMGAYEAVSPGTWAGMAEFGSATGVTPKVALYYSTWNSGFNTTFAQAARSHGAYVFVELEPFGVSLASIAAGRSDNYLRTYASTIREFGHPVILSFAHEMNGNWYSWGDGHVTPAEFIAAWRHVVQVFRAEGASNVTWVWTVNNTIVKDSLRPWWPGAKWVDWVGVDGYYVFHSDSFDSVFGTTIAQIRAFSHAPVMIAETAVGVTTNRETQIANLFDGAHTDHIVALVWFDKTQNAGVYHQNWRLEDDPAALGAFKQAQQA